MNRLFLLAAIIVIPSNAFAVEGCPVSLVLNVPRLTTADAKTAQRYAVCVSVPWLPTADGLRAKLAECGKNRSATARPKLKKALDWVDHIAAQFPACETRLQIKRSRNA